MSMTRYWWTPYLYAMTFGCSVTVVEVASKTSLVAQLVPEKHQAARFARNPMDFMRFWPRFGLFRLPKRSKSPVSVAGGASLRP